MRDGLNGLPSVTSDGGGNVLERRLRDSVELAKCVGSFDVLGCGGSRVAVSITETRIRLRRPPTHSVATSVGSFDVLGCGESGSIFSMMVTGNRL